MDRSQTNECAVTHWLQQNAISVRHLEAGNGFADLQPLKQILGHVQIVGLGEATHGTREFFQLKHRLVEFLVSEMNFTVFAIEASYAACQPVNEYILSGKGERATVLAGQHYLAWVTEEFSALLDWLRAYNQGVPDDRKVRFSGLDMTFNEHGRRAVLEYLGRVAPDRVAATDELFRVIAREEAKWPTRIDDESQLQTRQAVPALQELIGYLNEHQDELARRSSAAELERMLQFARVMWQRCTSGDSARSQHMAENLLHLIGREYTDAKVIFWGHNFHVGVETFPDKEPTFGYVLREQFGDAYLACALEFSQGSYQTRTLDSEGLLSDLKVATIGPPPEGSLPWHLSRADVGNALVNLYSSPSDPVVEQWLDTPQIHHAIGWAYDDPMPYEPAAIRQRYDAVAFLEKSTPARPTSIALEMGAKGEGL
jgi:erythromycin esterase